MKPWERSKPVATSGVARLTNPQLVATTKKEVEELVTTILPLLDNDAVRSDVRSLGRALYRRIQEIEERLCPSPYR